MGCNTKTSVEADFSSVASTIATIELATPLAYQYPDSLQEGLVELNDPTLVIPSIRYGIDTLTNVINHTLYPEVIESDIYAPIIASEYPSLTARLNSGSRITYTELADFLNYMAYRDASDFDRKMAGSPRQAIIELDDYYEDQMSGSSVSLCSLLDNPFANVAGLLENITGMTGNILGMLPAIANQLMSFAETIKQKVESIFQNMKNVVANLATSAQSLAQGLSNIPAAFAGIAQGLSQKFAALQNLFSDINLENIKEAVDKFVTKAALQFRKLLENPEVILYLLYMFCKTASFIEQSLKNPVEAFQGLLFNVEHEQNVLRIKSAPKTQRAIAAGRQTATDDYVEKVRRVKATSHNDAVSTEVTTKPEETSENTKYVFQQSHTTHPDPNSWSHLAFAPSVINNQFWKRDINVKMEKAYGGGVQNPKKLGLGVDIGYYGCKIEVLEMLNEVGKMLGKKLTVNSAFRHPVYNQYLRNTGHGAALHSQHTKGVALDVSMSGVNRNQFVAAAKKVGFRGIGYYNTFIHVDTGTARTWKG